MSRLLGWAWCGRLPSLGFIVLGYLCGSVSFVYWVGRLWAGVDPRDVGSRKLSGSNLYPLLGFWGMASGGILDLGRATLPIWLARRMGCALEVQVLAGLSAMAGHNWPLFLGFRGGRGLAAAGALLLVVFPWGVAWLLAGLALGRIWPHLAAAPALGACLTLPFLAAILGEPPAIVWGCVGLVALTIAKRLEGNREPLPPGETRLAVLGRRLLLDRDIADFRRWSRRGLSDNGIADEGPGTMGRHELRSDGPP